jgi:hypothetical protein
MDDRSSRASACRVIEIVIAVKGGPRCHFCGCEGVIVDRFPRRE